MTSKETALHHHLIEHARKPHRPVLGTAQLTYYIFEGVLVGFIESDLIHIMAWSGGGGGSRVNSPSESANNPYMYALKEVDTKKSRVHLHGGPIPPGSYQIYTPEIHPKLKLSAKLGLTCPRILNH